MIGRTDIVIDTPLSRQETLALCVGRLAFLWPGCVFEDAEYGAVYHSYRDVSISQTHELFGYRDPAAYASWEDLGADETNANTMVHLLCYDTNKLTIVVDDEEDPDMRAYIAAVRESFTLGNVVNR